VVALVETGWLDEHAEHRLVVHDWHQHAPNWVKGVVARQGGFLTQGNEPKVADPELATQGVPPPSPSFPNHALPNHPPPSPTADAGGWGAVAGELLELGIKAPRKAADAAKASGCTADEVRRGIEWYRRTKHNYPADEGPRVLYERISCWQPGQDAMEGWPQGKHSSARYVEPLPPVDPETRKAAGHIIGQWCEQNGRPIERISEAEV
jgi:hypothetical protein